MNDTGLLTEGVSWRDYLELCKPNVVGLMLVTSVIGMMLSTKEAVPLITLIFGNLGIAFCAASAAIVNHVVDRHVDDKMARTIGAQLLMGESSRCRLLCSLLLLGVVEWQYCICLQMH